MSVTTDDEPTRPGRRRGQARHPNRDLEIWRAYCAGSPQDAIARRFGVSQPTVSRAIDRVRKSIPVEDRDALIRREIAFLEWMRTEMIKDFQAELPPAFDQKGNALEHPETGELVRDATNRYAAFDRALRAQAEFRKLLGLDAPTSSKVDVDQRTEVRYVLQIEGFTVEDLR